MKKPIAIVVLIIFLINALVLSCNQLVVIEASTISGIIKSDITWTKANSPYALSGPTAVNQGVTLTIEPGTIVNLHGYYIQVNGTLTAIGTSSDPIHFSSGSAIDVNNPFGPYTPPGIGFYASSVPWNEQTNSGCIIENAAFNSTQIGIYSSPKIANTTGASLLIYGSPIISDNSPIGLLEYGGSPLISGNICGGIRVYEGSPTIVNNLVDGGDSWGIALGVRYPLDKTEVSVVKGNIIVGSYEDGIIATGTATIQDNLILLHSTMYAGYTGISVAGSDSNINIESNTIVGSAEAINIENTMSSALMLRDNNFVNISGGTSVYCDSPNNYNLANNWWGTTNTSAIANSIHDSKNDFNLGTVNFLPILAAPNSQAPDPNTYKLSPSPTPMANPTETLSPTNTGIPPSPSPTASSSNNSSQDIITFVVVPILIGIILALVIAIALMRKKNAARLTQT